jgi:serine protease Do
VRGVRVRSVHPSSPAAAGGLRGGADQAKADLVVAVDGTPVTTPEELGAAINRHAVGDTVQMLLFGDGKYRLVTLALRESPAAAGQAAKPAAGRPKGARPARTTPSPGQPALGY